MKEIENEKKRIQIIFNSDAWAIVEQACNDANLNFENGEVTYTDVVNEMVLNSKVDIKVLQSKHIDVCRSIKNMAQMKVNDIDFALKTLTDLKAKMNKRASKATVA